MLSLPPEEQARLNGPGCLTCDMSEDFHSAWEAVKHDKVSKFTPQQSELLEQIRQTLDSLKQSDCECFNPEMVKRPAWQSLREQSRAALLALGWEDATVQPYVEKSPGVWERGPSGADPQNDYFKHHKIV